MFNLLPLVMGIVLTSIITITTISILSPSSSYGLELQQRIVEDFNRFDAALSDYYLATVAYTWAESCPPSATVGTSDPSCVFDRVVDPANDGTLNTASWTTELVSAYMYLPHTIQGSVWSMGDDALGTYACIELNYDNVVSKALQGLITHYGTDSFRVGSACAVATSITKNDIKAYGGAKIYATKWLNY